MALLIGLDIGTTSLKCILLDSDQGRVVQVATRPTPVQHPQPDWSEHDPEALWQAVRDCLQEICRQRPDHQPVAGLAISSMAEAGVAVDSSGQPLAPIIAWYDRRSEPQASWIESQIAAPALYAITGQRVSPSFGATKLLWMREHLPQSFSCMSTWLPVPAYLLQRLCGQPAIDVTIAARTLLFDQHTLNWSGEVLAALGLDRAILPPVHFGGTQVGVVTQSAARETGLPAGTPCILGGHDHLCASLATGAIQPGAVVDSTGTAQALLMLLPEFTAQPSLAESGYACYAYLLEGRYAFKGGLKAAGSSIEWLARRLAPNTAPLPYADFEAEAWQGIGKRAGPLWLPHWIGSGTPQGDRFSRAALVGVQYEHDRGDLFRALLEALACWLRHNLDEMSHHTGVDVQTVTLTGGITRLGLLSQLKADVLRRPVQVSQIPETSAVGAALLAGLGAGVYDSAEQAVQSLQQSSVILEPDSLRADWYDALYREGYYPLYEALRTTHESLHRLQSHRPEIAQP